MLSSLIELMSKEEPQMRIRATTATAAAGALACVLLSGGVAAAHASGLQLNLQLTSHRVATPTAATLHLVYPDSGPGGKPKPVSEGVYRFPPGTTIDETAVPACEASNAELDLLGSSACPASTGLGGGGITVDTGLGPPIDPFALDDSYVHGPGQLITLFRAHGTPGPVLQVNRLRIEQATIIDRPSLPPGYPPGTKTVAKEVNQEIAPAFTDGGAFMTTPKRCPRSGAWVSRLTITYQDGTVESAKSLTPCET
jgi:hypothetical protein